MTSVPQSPMNIRAVPSDETKWESANSAQVSQTTQVVANTVSWGIFDELALPRFVPMPSLRTSPGSDELPALLFVL